MIPEAREVRLRRNDRKVLEARCRSPVTLQRDLKRARIVLLAADGRSTRSIAKEVGVQPRIVSLWRHRYSEQGLEGLEDKPRPGKKPIYTKATDKRILGLLDKPPPEGFARWTGPLLAQALGDVDVQYVWRFLRRHKIDLEARKSWCESNDPDFTAKAADVVGLINGPRRGRPSIGNAQYRNIPPLGNPVRDADSVPVERDQHIEPGAPGQTPPVQILRSTAPTNR